MKSRNKAAESLLVVGNLVRIAVLGSLCLLPLVAPAADFTPLGDLPGGEFSSRAGAVSDEGSVVVGESRSADGREAFRWTTAGGMVGLGDLPGTIFLSSATDVSADGSIVVGAAGGEFGFQAFCWTDTDSMTVLGEPTVAGAATSASQMSPDGAVVVGFMSLGGGQQAFRWKPTDGITELPYLGESGIRSSANSVSADGTVIVGFSENPSEQQAVRWTSSDVVGLGFLPGGTNRSGATATSADGSIIFGYAEVNSGYQAFRWTAAGGMEPLGDVPEVDHQILILETSADGDIAVGVNLTGPSTEKAIIWTRDGGIQPLAEVLAANGATIPPGWTLKEANGVSANGRWVVGVGRNRDGFDEAFLADIRPSGSSGGGSIDLLSLLIISAVVLWRARRQRSRPFPAGTGGG